MTETEKLAELRYIGGFSFRVLDKKVPEQIPYRIMSLRQINKMEKQRIKQEIWKRVHSYSRGK